MVDSAYAHPYQASAEGQRTRTYRTAASRDNHARKWADELGQIVNIFEHSEADGWGLVGRIKPANLVEASDGWPCGESGCEAPIEANPGLFVTLAQDGTWEIEGIGDVSASVTCQEGHAQDNPELKASLSAFLEKEFPGSTWAGSEPR
jgi:hypothetical protein